MNINKIYEYNRLLNLESQINNTNDKNDNISFTEVLKNALDKVNQMQLQSDEYNKLLVTGEVDNLHDVSIASEKAYVALQITLSIRNKILEAYKEIMRMQI
ncbi:MAG TPA: flagellar hook-basal body complex protein FliE [Tissierellaceae bacterium]